ncbi:MAG: hypothetical protein KDJ29_16630 [Hyphomicrobiales bacterium]|jgi:hypothetical protein|uniref:hypothetical protein n=1 Tax=Paracoccus sp. TaxID=267 RepID=UPI0035B3828A|nr:hypothetical protein [Hyphomicrobiales bacterium]
MTKPMSFPPGIAWAVSLFVAGTAQVNAEPFNNHQVWTFECRLTALDREGYFPTDEDIALHILWNRDADLARTVTPSGNGKGLGVISGFTDSNQNTVHFWMSPATAKFTGEETKNGRYGGWIEGFGPTIISIRSQGHAAMTRHDIIYGEMKAFSSEGTCEISGHSLEPSQ